MDWLIPTSMAALGSVLLAMAFILPLIDMPGGVNWSKVAAWCAFLGGFGAIGGAGGWLGNTILGGSHSAMSFGQRWGQQAFGVGAVVVVLLVLMAWVYSRLGKGGGGVNAKGSGKTAKVKSLLICALIAIGGATVAALIPGLYQVSDRVVNAAGGALRDLVSVAIAAI